MKRFLWLAVLAAYLVLAEQTATDAEVRHQIWFGAQQIGNSVARHIDGLVAGKVPLG